MLACAVLSIKRLNPTHSDMSVSLISNIETTGACLPETLNVCERALNAGETILPQNGCRLSISTYGVDFVVWADCDRLLRDSLTYLPPGWMETDFKSEKAASSVSFRLTSPAGMRTKFILRKRGRELACCDDKTELLERFRSIVALHVADNSRDLIFMHAGVVGWGDRAIVFPGRSMSGKTTLVADLVRAGATYYSDDFALIDSHGSVHPYPRPLQIRDGCTKRQTSCPIEQLGGVAGKSPLPIALVVVSQYKAQSTWQPRELSPGMACLRMLDNTISARSAPEMALRTLRQVTNSALIVRGIRGDSSQVMPWIIDQLGQLN